ncbi:diaminobutyrate acetyltransferase [Virgibacillus phasianinus]|uniref:L-2,4-diaminobutyric acid acetyltransferase n=1 Tax=Virgibacillus phasianinus TaxID=2017483 RepID=A0A220U6W0_9BACI|nr:diaminobutyrate acetyltransferase [Virgibacillus phasianinus]ASK63830.1 diaminobutyrate acetyltransferase [Virgibacillus phasianinus]
MTKTRDITSEFRFRKTNKDDGARVFELIKHTGVLDLNSSYSYLMWCEIFSETSIVVERDGDSVAFISGFIHPDAPNTLFIWQVAVHESERGKGLGTRMLVQLLKREACRNVRYVEATVSPSNRPSQQLFLGLAKKLDTNCKLTDYFLSSDFPRTGHEDEQLYKIGPIDEENKLVKE